MNDTEILLSILLRYEVNIHYFKDWYVSNFEPNYNYYLEDYEGLSLTCKKLDEFSYNFLVASLTWKRVI